MRDPLLTDVLGMTEPQGEKRREKRSAFRYPVSVPVELEHGTGITRNLSVSGVYFETDHPVHPDAPFRFALVLVNGRLNCEGRIVRVEGREGKLGVAAAITTSQFVQEAEATSRS
jgi:hypothetical protein